MPRTGRGGSRQGKVGTAYSNRSDLNGSKPAVAEYQGQPYGQRKAQVDAQRAMPVGPPPTTPQPAPAVASGPPTPATAPGSLGSLTAPTARPGEPLTAGVAVGPGPGPTTGDPRPGEDSDMLTLRAVYRAHPSPALRRLIESMEGA